MSQVSFPVVTKNINYMLMRLEKNLRSMPGLQVIRQGNSAVEVTASALGGLLKTKATVTLNLSGNYYFVSITSTPSPLGGNEALNYANVAVQRAFSTKQCNNCKKFIFLDDKYCMFCGQK